MNTNKQIVIFPRGQLVAKDRAEMAKAGFLAIEADDPSKVVVVIPGSPLATADDLLMAAMWGLSKASSSANQDFVNALHNRMRRRDTNPPPAPAPEIKP